MNDCGGPAPIHMFRRAIERMNKPNYQLELFSVLEESRWIPMQDKFYKDTYYHLYPYDYALNYVSSWEKKNA